MYANVHDTLIAHHSYASHYPQKLDQVVSEYCDASPWKVQHGMRDVGEKGAVIESMGGEELALYNGQDCRLTALAWGRMQGDLDKERVVYEHDMELAKVCSDMTWDGIAVDGVKRSEIESLLDSRKTQLRDEIRRLIGEPDFAPGKLGDVRRVLFSAIGSGVRAKRGKSGELSTDNETLEALQGLGADTDVSRFAASLLKWRLVGKVKSTYLDPIPISKVTLRAHYGWKPYGTVSGRLAGRLQSCPRYDPKVPEGRVRELYTAAPGNVLVYYDVSQAEMRLAAFLSADPVFMKVAVESDVHAGNAAAVFPEVAAKGWLAGKAKSDPAKGKPYRDIAKNLGFAIAYGAEADKVYTTLRRKGFDVTMRAVELILVRLRSAYKVYYRWAGDNVARVGREGYMRSPIMGRIRWFGKYPNAPDIYNYPVQSALADIVNLRMIGLRERLPRGAQLVAQVHDACIYDCPKDSASHLEGLIDAEWAKPVTLLGGDLVLPIDRKRGERWSDL